MPMPSVLAGPFVAHGCAATVFGSDAARVKGAWKEGAEEEEVDGGNGLQMSW